MAQPTTTVSPNVIPPTAEPPRPTVEEGYKFMRVDLFWIQVMFFIFAIFLFAVCMYACLFVRWVYKRRLNQKIEDMINRYYRDDENRKRAQIDMKREEIGAGEFKQDCICRKNQHICQIPKIITDGKNNEDADLKAKGSKEGVKIVRIDEQKGGSDMKQPSATLQKIQSKNTLSFHDIVKGMQSDPDLVKTMPVLKQAVQDVACQTVDDSLFPQQLAAQPPLAPIIAPPGPPKKQRSNNDLFEDYGSMSYYENNGKVSGVMNSSQMSEPPTAPTTTAQPTTASSSAAVTTPPVTTTTAPSTSTPTTRTPPIVVTKKPSTTPKPLKKKKSVAKSQDTPTASEEDNAPDPMVSMKEPKEKDLGGKNSSVASVFFPINNVSSPFAENSTRLFPFFNKANPKPPTTSTSSKKSSTADSKSSDNNSSKYL